MTSFYRITWGTIFILFVIFGMKMSVDEYNFHVTSPIMYGFHTTEIPIRKLPFPTVDLIPLMAVKAPSVKKAKR
jgi:hypothetical protein